MGCIQVIGQLGVGGEGGGVQAGRCVVQFLALAPLGEGEAFVVVGRRIGAILVEGEFGPSPSNPLAVGRGVGRQWGVDQHAPQFAQRSTWVRPEREKAHITLAGTLAHVGACGIVVDAAVRLARPRRIRFR